MNCDICYVISHRDAARIVLDSKLIPELARRGLGVAIVSPDADEKSMQEFGSRYGIQIVQAPKMRIRFSDEQERFRKYVFENVKANPALRAKHERDLYDPSKRWWRKHQARAYFALNDLAVDFPAIGRFFQKKEQRKLNNVKVRQLLESLEPTVVVSVNPVSPIEASFILEGEKLGIKTAVQLLDWDGITARGRFAAVPGHFLSWSPVMTEEIQEYYAADKDKIFECGVPHLAVHEQNYAGEPIASALSTLQLDPNKPYLFFAMSSPDFAIREIDVVERLAKRIEENAFGDTMQLVVRSHSAIVEDADADEEWTTRLKQIKSSRVGVDYLQAEKNDLPHLAALIAGCSVSINSGTTLCLDSVLQDKPVVLPIFDGSARHPWWQSVRRAPAYIHLKKLIEFDCLEVAHSFEAFEQAINEYIAHPTRGAEDREEARQRETGGSNALAASRAANALAQLAGAAVKTVDSDRAAQAGA